jgi:high-affinity nickel-transport protein
MNDSSRCTAPKVPLRDRLTRDEWRRMGLMFGFIAFLHIAGALLMWKATTGGYKLSDGSLFGWGTAALAYTLGMRHAFDADHISAIDNTTRKLMAEGKRPLAVGFFFSLGHSSVVATLAILLNFGIKAVGSQLKNDNSTLHHYTGLSRHNSFWNILDAYCSSQSRDSRIDRRSLLADAQRSLQRRRT